MSTYVALVLLLGIAIPALRATKVNRVVVLRDDRGGAFSSFSAEVAPPGD
jgi:hypothetical protein